MVTRDIYTTTVDEDVQDETISNQRPECGGRVTTNTVEPICEACGLIVDEQRTDHGPEWRACDRDERKRTGASLTAARHDLTDVARVEHWRVQNAYKAVNAELGLPATPVTPSEFVPRLASELEVPDQIRHRATELAKRADQWVLRRVFVRPDSPLPVCTRQDVKMAGVSHSRMLGRLRTFQQPQCGLTVMR